VKAGGKERVEVNDVIGEWDSSEGKFRADYRGVENVIDGGLDHQRHQAFGESDDGD
jgi:hypothetical protein